MEQVTTTSLEKEINDINTVLETSSEENWAYNHELLWYGVDGFVHSYLMQKALDVSEGKLSIEEFISKYNITHHKRFNCPQIPINSIMKEGIFIPSVISSESMFNTEKRKVIFFNGDYLNVVNDPDSSFENKEYAIKLMNSGWRIDKILDKKSVEDKIKVGNGIFLTSVSIFHKFKNGYAEGPYEDEPIMPQSKELNAFSERLIKYYSDILGLGLK